jgi:hypothetical protein
MASPNLSNTKMQMCINDCFDCHSTCLETVAYCLQKGKEHASEPHILLLQDCAEVSQACVGLMIRGSDFFDRVCAICADVCESCAKSCDGFKDDLPMKACAIACWRCADSCRSMAGG